MKQALCVVIGALLMGFILSGCSGEGGQAQKYYEMGEYEAALTMANKALKRDKDDVEMAALIWKIQIVTQFCEDVKSVEYACSSIREMALPYGERVLPVVRKALQEEKGCIKLFAVLIAGNIDSPEVYPILAELAEGKVGPLEEGGSITREMIQGGALVTLGQRGNKEAFQLMVDATRSDSGELRAMATEAIGYVGDEEAVPFLEGLLNDDFSTGGERTVAVAASRSLKMITGNDYEID